MYCQALTVCCRCIACLVGEDDGFLLVYTYEAATDNSYLHVYDAKTMDPTPLAQVGNTFVIK